MLRTAVRLTCLTGVAVIRYLKPCLAGMHVYPTFLATNAALLCGLTLSMLLIKYLAGFFVFNVGLRAVDVPTAHVLSVGLAQVGISGC